MIPARGASKRIPRKNIKMFCGNPVIKYAIDAAFQSKLFDHVVVSTDDDEIADIARQLGAKTPFVRPSVLSDDHTPTTPVVAHAIQTCEELGWRLDYVCCIYPAAPLVQSTDLEGALELLKVSDADYSFSVTEFPSNIHRALKRSNDGRIIPVHPENELIRTQDLDPAYYDAGLFYWGLRDAWLENSKIHSKIGRAHV